MADNAPGSRHAATFRNLWQHIGKSMPKKGRSKASALDPLLIPPTLQTALGALYGHYEKTFASWRKADIEVPPCFIVVCNNTATSKLVYDYISGFHREGHGGFEGTGAGPAAALQEFRRIRSRARSGPVHY